MKIRNRNPCGGGEWVPFRFRHCKRISSSGPCSKRRAASLNHVTWVGGAIHGPAQIAFGKDDVAKGELVEELFEALADSHGGFLKIGKNLVFS
jgi:hypothetical protein